nr:TPA_exp: hirudin variant hnip_hv4 [Hirudo nipponia]
MFSLKLFLVFLVVCISVSQENKAELLAACTGKRVTLCACNGVEFCGRGKKCKFGSTPAGNKCVKDDSP